MKKHKFKFWHITRKEMFLCHGINWNEDGQIIYSVENDEERAMPVEDAEEVILLENTGLYDDRNKEIYEGDVIRVTDSVNREMNLYREPYHHQVLWNEKLGGFTVGGMLLGSVLSTKRKTSHLDSEHERYFEVIGNIYEDPQYL